MSKFKNLSKISRIILIISLALVVCLILAGLVYWFIASRLLSREYKPDLIISSPDGQYELVVREWYYLVGGGAEIYIRETKWYNRWMMKEIGATSSEDPCFAEGHYYVEWESDKVTIYYYKGLGIENCNDRSTWRGIVSYDLD